MSALRAGRLSLRGAAPHAPPPPAPCDRERSPVLPWPPHATASPRGATIPPPGRHRPHAPPTAPEPRTHARGARDTTAAVGAPSPTSPGGHGLPPDLWRPTCGRSSPVAARLARVAPGRG